ncbi:toxin-antitoxin system YwqK family antitoxin [Flavobacterium sp.]|uniref:toxin-antitoxin system YwqK family antitoxin n=1 Tax=Flavobacterium sp. TaxID=239 RepID=UPI003B9A07C4
MKYLPTLLLLFALNSYCQESAQIIYLDSLDQKTAYGKHQSYASIGSQDSSGSFEVSQFSKDGILIAKGKSAEPNTWVKTGIVTAYFPDGTIKSKISYEKDMPSGAAELWYPNGKKQLEGSYHIPENNKIQNLKIDNFWDANGNHQVSNGNGTYEGTTTEIFGYEILEKGTIKDGYRDGSWILTSANNKEKWTLNYANNAFTDGIYIDETGNSENFTELFTSPIDNGGKEKIMKHLVKNLIIPENLTSNIKVITNLTIGLQGGISNVTFPDKLDATLEKNIKIALLRLKDVKPATKLGKKISYTISFPINIQASN